MLQSLILEQISTSGSLWTVCLLHISLPGRQDKMHSRAGGPQQLVKQIRRNFREELLE